MPRGPVRVLALALFLVAVVFFIFGSSSDSAEVEYDKLPSQMFRTPSKWGQELKHYANTEKWRLWKQQSPQRFPSTTEKLDTTKPGGDARHKEALEALRSEGLAKEDVAGHRSSGTRLNEINAERLPHAGGSEKQTEFLSTNDVDDDLAQDVKKPVNQESPPKTPEQVEGADIARQLLKEEHKDMLQSLDPDTADEPEPAPPKPTTRRKRPSEMTSSLATGNHLSKTLVIGKPEEQPADWIKQEFSDFKTVIYDISPSMSTVSGASLLMPLKGGAALAFLTYITEYYNTLSDVTLFISAMPFQSTQKNRLFDGEKDYKAQLTDLAPSLHSMNTSYIQERGYTSLRCQHMPGCTSQTIIRPSATWVFAQPWHHEIHAVWRALFPTEDDIPETISSPWVGQFAVTKEQVRKRPLSQYQAMRKWIQSSRTEEGALQRVMTSLWHVVFSKPAVDCPPEKQCVCELYGECTAADERAAAASDGKAVDDVGKVIAKAKGVA